MWIEELNGGKFKFVERYEDFLTGKTKRVSVTMDKNTRGTQKTAQAILQQKINSAMKAVPESGATLKYLVDCYRSHQAITVKKSTYGRNFHSCNTLLSILGESTIADRITAKYVIDCFLATGKANSTLNEHLIRFKALIRFGYRNDLISNISFLDKIERFKDISHKEKIQNKYLESSELKILIDGINHPFWGVFTQFLAMSGLRFGEACALTLNDIDFKNKVIHVSKNYDYINMETTTPKTLCSIRDVFLQDELFDLCKAINSIMLRQRLMHGYKNSELFFTGVDGKHISFYAYNKYLRTNSTKLIGRPITAHALRHTHASLLLENGVGIDTISRRLGHENSQITRDIYLHITEKLKEKDNEKLASIAIM